MVDTRWWKAFGEAKKHGVEVLGISCFLACLSLCGRRPGMYVDYNHLYDHRKTLFCVTALYVCMYVLVLYTLVESDLTGVRKIHLCILLPISFHQLKCRVSNSCWCGKFWWKLEHFTFVWHPFRPVCSLELGCIGTPMSLQDLDHRVCVSVMSNHFLERKEEWL